jgi:phosphinothricin acetyltransferase
MKTRDLNIRKADINDLSTITRIYNDVIEEGVFTADLKTFTPEQRKHWFNEHHDHPYEILVLEQDGETRGYFYFSPWRQGRAALSKVAEISFFLDKTVRGKGLGDTIMAYALEQAGECGFSHLIAILLDINERSRGLLEKWGFKPAGALPGIVELSGRQAGQLIMLKEIRS